MTTKISRRKKTVTTKQLVLIKRYCLRKMIISMKKPKQMKWCPARHQYIIPQGHSKLQESLLKPLPLIPKGSAFQEGLEVPKWRQKKTAALKNIASKTKDAKNKVEQYNQPEVMKEEIKIKNELIEEPCSENQSTKAKTVEYVQDKLKQYGEQIPILNAVQIDQDKYPRYFKYPVYESYKPKNIMEARKIIQLYIQQSRPQSQLDFDSQYFDQYVSYLQQEMKTQFPSFINERQILSFESNFECGNLDSAYVMNENEYNLLMKVDTNTKGSSFWFYFQVSGLWKLPKSKKGRTIKFNILNFSKSDLKNFYSQGMNIMTKVGENGEWQTDKCFEIEFFQNQEIERCTQKEQSQKQLFYQLSFKFNFTFENYCEDGPPVWFSYCRPYSYSDLLSDLRYIKYQLLNDPAAEITYYGNDKKRIENHQRRMNNKEHKLDKKIEENHEANGQTNEKQGNSQVNGNQVIERMRLNQYQLQHMDIRNRGLKIIKLNTIEKNLINENTKNTTEQAVISPYEEYQPKYDDCKLTFRDCIYNDAIQGESFQIRTTVLNVKQEILCRSVGGVPIYQITVQLAKNQKQRTKVIYISARAHAGECPSSFVMQKLLFELCLAPNEYMSLLQNYVIKFVPMINVDGVILGNSRTSLVGLDLNRRWTQPNALVHPEVYFFKKEMIKVHRRSEGIQIFCDLHGHNKSPNAFVYGCHKAANQGFLSWTKTRLLPKIIATMSPIFDFQACRFKIDNCKLNTARVVCWNELKITNSFTFEVSMFGKLINNYGIISHEKTADIGDHLNQPQCNNIENEKQTEKLKTISCKIKYFQVKDLHEIAISLLKSFVHYNNIEPELEQEFSQNGGWLKVQKLNNMTGKAARDKIQESIQLIKAQNKIKQVNAEQSPFKSGNQKQIPSKGQSITRQGFVKKSFNEEAKNAYDLGAFNANSQQTSKQIYQPQNESAKTQYDKSFKYNQATSNLKFSPPLNNQLNHQFQQTQSNSFKINSVTNGIFGVSFGKQRGRSIYLQDDDVSKNNDSLQSDSQMIRNSFQEDKFKQNLQHRSMWKDYFDLQEFETLYSKEDAYSNNEESNINGSDSDPSEDNIDQYEFLQMIEDVFKDDKEVTFTELKSYLDGKDANSIDKPPLNQQIQTQTISTINEEICDETVNSFIGQPQPEVNQDYQDGKEQQQLFEFNYENSPITISGTVALQSNTNNASVVQLQNQSLQNIPSQSNISENSSKQQNQTFSSYYAYQKSPVTFRDNSTHYAGWSIRKQQQSSLSQHEKVRQMQKLSNLRSSTQKQKQNIIVKSNLFNPSKQIISDMVAGGLPKLKEIEKNIFAVNKSTAKTYASSTPRKQQPQMTYQETEKYRRQRHDGLPVGYQKVSFQSSPNQNNSDTLQPSYNIYHNPESLYQLNNKEQKEPGIVNILISEEQRGSCGYIPPLGLTADVNHQTPQRQHTSEIKLMKLNNNINNRAVTVQQQLRGDPPIRVSRMLSNDAYHSTQNETQSKVRNNSKADDSQNHELVLIQDHAEFESQQVALKIIMAGKINSNVQMQANSNVNNHKSISPVLTQRIEQWNQKPILTVQKSKEPQIHGVYVKAGLPPGTAATGMSINRQKRVSQEEKFEAQMPDLSKQKILAGPQYPVKHQFNELPGISKLATEPQPRVVQSELMSRRGAVQNTNVVNKATFNTDRVHSQRYQYKGIRIANTAAQHQHSMSPNTKASLSEIRQSYDLVRLSQVSDVAIQNPSIIARIPDQRINNSKRTKEEELEQVKNYGRVIRKQNNVVLNSAQIQSTIMQRTFLESKPVQIANEDSLRQQMVLERSDRKHIEDNSKTVIQIQMPRALYNSQPKGAAQDGMSSAYANASIKGSQKHIQSLSPEKTQAQEALFNSGKTIVPLKMSDPHTHFMQTLIRKNLHQRPN